MKVFAKVIAASAIAFTFTLSITGDVAAADAPPSNEATTHFQRALELYQEQDFAGALVEFRRAYDLAPTYKLFYNIGQVCYQLTDYACALRSFESYVKEGGGSISTERRTEVDRELAKLRLRVGHLEIVTNVPGVDITIDDVSVGKTPLPASVVVSTGKRHIVGSREGYAPVSRIVEVAGTDSSRVELVFSSSSGGGGGNGGSGGDNSGGPRYESRWNTISWIGIGATAAFGITSGVTGGLALSTSNDLEKKTFADGVGPTQDMRSMRSRAETLSVISDVALGLSAASLIGTLVYTFVHNPKVIETSGTSGSALQFTGDGVKGTF